jgi:hypothetical protein
VRERDCARSHSLCEPATERETEAQCPTFAAKFLSLATFGYVCIYIYKVKHFYICVFVSARTYRAVVAETDVYTHTVQIHLIHTPNPIAMLRTNTA